MRKSRVCSSVAFGWLARKSLTRASWSLASCRHPPSPASMAALFSTDWAGGMLAVLLLQAAAAIAIATAPTTSVIVRRLTGSTIGTRRRRNEETGDSSADRHRGGDLLEEVVALVVDDHEGREVDDLDAPNGLHAQFGVFEDLHP